MKENLLIDKSIAFEARIDNIHITNWGNDKIFEALCEKLGL